MYDIAIIGAGVVGGMIARKLSSYNVKICILEKENDVAMGATKANSAIVHAGFDAKVGSLKAKLNVRGSVLMEKVCEELGVKYRRNGSLVIGFDDADRAMINELYKRGKSNGVEGLKLLEKDRLKELEPNISENAVCALYAPTGAIVCPYELAIAAIGNAMDNGAELVRNFCVTSINESDGYYEVCSEKEKITAEYVINCAGIYADEVAGFVGDNTFVIHPRKGEYMLLDKECGNTVSHTIFRTPTKMGKGILVSPTVDGNLLLGPTSEDMDDKKNKNTTAEGFARIAKEARENVCGIPFNKVITSFSGLRAVGNTGDFIINSPKTRFINVAGIESPGLSASPAIAEYVCDMLMLNGLKLVEKENYNPQRAPMHKFKEADAKEKNEMIKKNPAYGKIVCRCEGVSEGEILDAIRMNPGACDLDGVKRRTRAQMGRCQGGFCSPYIVELIARENDVPCEAVTKSGGTSYVIADKTKGDA